MVVRANYASKVCLPRSQSWLWCSHCVSLGTAPALSGPQLPYLLLINGSTDGRHSTISYLKRTSL